MVWYEGVRIRRKKRGREGRKGGRQVVGDRGRETVENEEYLL